MLPDDDYTNAEAFILTFSLNNFARDNPKFKVAMQWETEFLKIVQEYKRNPNTNFTFAYMAEVWQTMVLLVAKGLRPSLPSHIHSNQKIEKKKEVIRDMLQSQLFQGSCSVLTSFSIISPSSPLDL